MPKIILFLNKTVTEISCTKIVLLIKIIILPFFSIHESKVSEYIIIVYIIN